MPPSKHVVIVSPTAPCARLDLFAPHALLDITSGQVAPVVFNAVSHSITMQQRRHAKLVSRTVKSVHQDLCVRHAASDTVEPTRGATVFNAQEAPISMEPWKL